MTRDEVIAKVRALLEVKSSRGASENEARNAVRAAQRLMHAWRIEEAELEQKPGFVRRVLYSTPKRRPRWDMLLLLMVCSQNGVRGIRSTRRYLTEHRYTMELVGTEADILFVEYAYEFLRSEVQRLVNRGIASGHCRGREHIKAYRLGVVNGICESLRKEGGDGSPGLVLVNSRLADVDAFLGVGPTKQFRVTGMASVLGIEAGRQVRVRSPLGGGDVQTAGDPGIATRVAPRLAAHRGE